MTNVIKSPDNSKLNNRQREKFDMNNMKLATKTAVIMGCLIFAVFFIFICVTVIITRNSLIASVDSEFNNMAEKNAISVQIPFEDASQTAANLQSYCQDMFDTYLSLSESDSSRTEKEDSLVYHTPIERFNREMEEYFINTITSTVISNDDIMGAGIFFEPYAFDSTIESYSLYISADDTDTFQSYGAYDNYKDQVFYKNARNNKAVYFTPPYQDQGVTVISATYPVICGGEVQGVITVDINAGNFSKIAYMDERYPTMYQDILTEDGTIVYDSTTTTGEYVGVNLGEWLSAANADKMMASMALGEPFRMLDKNNEGDKIQRYFYPIQAGSQVWWALMGVDQADKEEAVYTTVFWMIVLAILAIVIIIAVAFTTLHKMINPIGKVVTAAESIAAGHFDINLDSDSNDEIGILTRSFANTARTLQAVIRDISSVLTEMARGNLRVTTSAQYVGELGEIESSIKMILENLNNTILHISEASGQVSTGSAQIASGAQSLAEGATDQASSIQELQATVTSISGQVEKNASNANDANDIAQAAGNELSHGNEQMKKMLQAMEDINNASNDIKNVISTIEDIAEQTNLLSLNASIEAARAGEAGRGFAVVAGQVGRLAAESAEATKTTTALIEASIKAVKNGIDIATVTARTIDTSVEKVNEVADNIQKISQATSDQSIALDQVAQGVEQISCVIEENSAMAEESASSSEELSAQAQVLDELVAKFQLTKKILQKIPIGDSPR